MTILKGGHHQFQGTCNYCACLFRYDRSDIDEGGDSVQCPDCRHTLSHLIVGMGVDRRPPGIESAAAISEFAGDQ